MEGYDHIVNKCVIIKKKKKSYVQVSSLPLYIMKHRLMKSVAVSLKKRGIGGE